MTCWYADSEYAPLQDVIIAPPIPFPSHLNPQYIAASSNYERALIQHQKLLAALTSRGVQCHVLDPDPDLPYQTYTRDSGVMTPWGLLITRMAFPARRQEPDRIEAFAKARGVPIWTRVDTGFLEGGDVLLLSAGVAAIGHNEGRTTQDAANEISSRFREMGWECRIISYPAEFIHLDQILGIVDATNCIVCDQTLKDEDIAWLRGQGFELHTVPKGNWRDLPCNVVSLGNKTIVTVDRNRDLNQKLSQKGFDVIALQLDEYVRDFGGPHCLTLPIRRVPSAKAEDSIAKN